MKHPRPPRPKTLPNPVDVPASHPVLAAVVVTICTLAIGLTGGVLLFLLFTPSAR